MESYMNHRSNVSVRSLSAGAPGIYIHIPFCVSKCAYCDFYSLPCSVQKHIGCESFDKAEETKRSEFTLSCSVQKHIGCESFDKAEGAKGYGDFSPEIYRLQSRYVDALCRQMRQTSEQYRRPRISTVFIGGGTPSVLRVEEMKRIFDTLRLCFDVPKSAEITLAWLFLRVKHKTLILGECAECRIHLAVKIRGVVGLVLRGRDITQYHIVVARHV